nr:MAG TPA: hypothetical protein [Caudoviricetes sp.]DAX90786.1 MAG TPA: hypothetical protein [Caudoviricetes sp.]
MLPCILIMLSLVHILLNLKVYDRRCLHGKSFYL